MPPDVTVGVERLGLGAVEKPPVFPVDPVFDEVDPPPVLEVVGAGDPFAVPVLAPAPDAPGWAWATTMPMATVAPAAARTVAFVALRRRRWAFALVAGVFG